MDHIMFRLHVYELTSWLLRRETVRDHFKTGNCSERCDVLHLSLGQLNWVIFDVTLGTFYKPKQDLFRSLTKWFLCVNLTRTRGRVSTYSWNVDILLTGILCRSIGCSFPPRSSTKAAVLMSSCVIKCLPGVISGGRIFASMTHDTCFLWAQLVHNDVWQCVTMWAIVSACHLENTKMGRNNTLNHWLKYIVMTSQEFY